MATDSSDAAETSLAGHANEYLLREFATWTGLSRRALFAGLHSHLGGRRRTPDQTRPRVADTVTPEEESLLSASTDEGVAPGRPDAGPSLATSEQGRRSPLHDLGDFTTTPRVLTTSAIAVGIGVLSAFVALVLLRLIGLVTNIVYYGRLNTSLVSPAGNHLGVYAVLVPVAGGLVIGLMARYGSERIRGHGIPEAIESILINGSRVEPRVAILKPASSAIAIGTGGPFGAEGPIIMTGGAFGSLIAQVIQLTAAERKTLLVAGAAGGMAATFAAPVSSAMLAVELLLFEWKPRSFVPVAMAAATAAIVRRYIIGLGPLFPLPPHAEFLGLAALLSCVLIGVLAGALSVGLTGAVYAAEDAFSRLPIHWMWWPILGGLVVGIGGLIQPRALGVGYDVIGDLLRGNLGFTVLASILLVKTVIWSVALGSGTSGGVLAPLLMIGGALGGVVGHVLPNQGPGFWSLICMAAVLGGTMRSPFTGIIFTVELTHDVTLLLPLMIGVTVAHAVTVLTMRRSILTEKISRRGYHLSREYAVDPLEFIFVREVMSSEVIALPADIDSAALRQRFPEGEAGPQRLYPMVDEARCLAGVVTGAQIDQLLRAPEPDDPIPLTTILLRPVVAYPDETLRAVVQRMAETGLTRFPVVEHGDMGRLLGIVSLRAVLQARSRTLEAERRRERVLPLKVFFPFGDAVQATGDGETTVLEPDEAEAQDLKRVESRD